MGALPYWHHGEHRGCQSSQLGTFTPLSLMTDHQTTVTYDRIFLRQSCKKQWDTRLTAKLRQTNLGWYKHSSTQRWRTYSPSRDLDTFITRLMIRHTPTNAHLHRLNIVQDPHCPWCPTQLDSPEHFLLQCPRFHSLCTILKASLARLNMQRPTLADLLGSDSLSTNTAFQPIKHTTTFLRKSGQLDGI